VAAIVTCVGAQGATVRTSIAELLTPDLREAARSESNDWIKRLRLVRYEDGRTMRERFVYRSDSLWWFTEIYLHKMTRLHSVVATTLALENARARYEPARLVIEAADVAVRVAAEAFGATHQVPVEIRSHGAGGPAHAWPSYLVGLSAHLSRLRPAAPPPARPAKVVSFVHTAFWRKSPGSESYIGPVLDAIAQRAGPDVAYVGIGPRRNFRARRWWDPLTSAGAQPAIIPVEQLAPRQALRDALHLWRTRRELARAIVAGPEIRAAGEFRGLDLWPVLRAELSASALVQWPWSARAMDEAGAAIDALTPGVVLTYAEAGGWGRAIVLEARRRGVPSVGVQHGFIYRHWLNYRHEPDEMEPQGNDAGFPAPDRTLVFDRFAADYLSAAGHFSPDRIVVTGNARLDDLAARVARQRGSDPDEHTFNSSEPIVLLAAKFSEMGDALPDLLSAVSRLPNVRLVIKTHPAETEAVYEPFVRSAPNVTIAPAHADLATLLASAQALVTVNSTVAQDGLVLGVPALVVGLPNNLSPFVEAGVMAGANGAEAIRDQLHALLYDLKVRDRLRQAAVEFTARYGMRADGGAADRAADAVLALTENN
jgi:hypothetical protein